VEVGLWSTSNLRPLRIDEEKKKKKERRKEEKTTAAKYNDLPYWAVIKSCRPIKLKKYNKQRVMVHSS